MKVQDKLPSPPSGWKEAKLGDVVEILDFLRVPINSNERARRKGTTPYYGATGQVGWIDDHLFDEELILLGEDGAPFLDPHKPKAYLIRGKSWVNNHAHVLRSEPGINNRFILYQLNQLDYKEFVSGSTRLKLPQGAMRTIPVVIAPTNEQQRIADELEKQFSRLDAAVKILRRVQSSLERLHAATFNAATEGRLVPTEAELARAEGRDYEHADVLLERILRERRAKWEADQLARMEERGKKPKDDKWKDKYEEPISPDTPDLVPEGWTSATVSQLISSTLIGLDRGSTQQSRNPSGLLPYIKMNNVTLDGRVTFDDIVYVAASEEEKNRFAVQDGDLLFNTRNSLELVGKVGLVKHAPTDAIYNNNLMRIRLMEGASPDFICVQMCSTSFRRKMEPVKKGTTNVAAIYAKDLFPLTLALPPFAEQLRISDEVERRTSVIEELKTLVVAALRRSDVLRQKILRDAFTGKLVSQDPADEHAGVLLERVAANRALREVEALKVRKERKGERMKRRTPRTSERKPRRPLREIVNESKRRLTPEQLFAEAGFTYEVVEDFYEELRHEIEAGHIEQLRPDSAMVYLITTTHETRQA